MIPYWHPEPIELPFNFFGAPLTFHVFGIMVGIGVLSGHWLSQRRSEKVGLSGYVTADMALWIVLVSFAFAHWISIFAYFPERVFGTACELAIDCPRPDAGMDPFICSEGGRCGDGRWQVIFEFWNGISSFGGFLGCAIALFTFFRLKKIIVVPYLFELVGGKNRPLMKYMDATAYGFSVGWFFGRMGCFSAHDHVGRPTNFPLAVNFPDGWREGIPAVAEFGEPGFTPRWDLGFMEVLFSAGIFLFFFLWANKQEGLRPGFHAAVFILAYAPYRFLLDILRATDIGGADKRYFADMLGGQGLTPGQIGAVIIFALGVAIWIAGGKRLKDPSYMDGSKFEGEGWAEGGRAKPAADERIVNADEPADKPADDDEKA